MKIVIDASMALAWIFERQKADENACSERMLLSLSEVAVLVPSLWHIEIINALLVGERRKIITEAQSYDFLTKLSHLPIKTDNEPMINNRSVVLAMAREYELTSYDSIYLELALRNNAALATFDLQLANAMRGAGGMIFGD